MSDKIPFSLVELERQLNEQLKLLVLLTEIYDKGEIVAAKPMATVLRILLHDTKNSKSLLGQLKKKTDLFYDTAELRQEIINGGTRAGSFSALLGVNTGANGRGGFVPHLDDLPGYEPRYVKFDTYWNEEIFYDQKKNSFTREDIVTYLADQDGGAHVDPGLDRKYAELSRQNSLGWVMSSNGKDWQATQGAELASVRQITHEILKTFLVSYIPPKPKREGLTIGGGGIILHTVPSSENGPIRRKGPCPCGSGKKYKRCHGA